MFKHTKVRIINNNYDITHNPKVKAKYPALYNAVQQHDRVSKGIVYTLGRKAYEEYLRYQMDHSVGYVCPSGGF